MTAVRARVTFLRTDEGGRFTPAADGYRPQIRLGSLFTSCIVRSPVPGETFDLGLSYDVDIELVFEALHADRFPPKDGVQLYEGSKLVARGRFIDDPR
ncbi:hypothetical protein [Actinoplanes sp. NPDC049118]|uniref:hypothetical protein n=1 Tax=Actinoplanes sp. NPDC049118 TaxID=3155769 RepID=UPI0033F46C6B